MVLQFATKCHSHIILRIGVQSKQDGVENKHVYTVQCGIHV